MRRVGSSRLWIALVVAALALAALLFAQARSRSGRAPEAGGGFAPELESAYAGLCTARSEVLDDLFRAKETFYSRSHTTLHVLARRLEDRDRFLAADLLEAKNEVESTLAAGVAGSARAALDRLVAISRQALISLGVEPPSCS